MGLKLKPAKCRSFSIKSGSPAKIAFKIDSEDIPSIADEKQQFLGCKLFLVARHPNAMST